MRDYAREYRNYHSKPEQRKNRSSRNLARILMRRKLGVKAVRGKDIDHKDKNPLNNSRKNLRVRSKSYNRSHNYA
jgi:hypothetical protein